MAQQIDLKSSISAAQREVDGWERRARLAGSAKPAGSRWPLTILMWAILGLAIYAERHVIEGWILPHDSSGTVAQFGEILRHAADDIEGYRAHFGRLPDDLPIDFLNGVVSYTHEGGSYTLEASYHDSLLRLEADASGPGPVEVLPR